MLCDSVMAHTNTGEHRPEPRYALSIVAAHSEAQKEQLSLAIDRRLKPGTRLIEELGTWESSGVWSIHSLVDDDNRRKHQKTCDRQAMHVLSVVMQEI